MLNMNHSQPVSPDQLSAIASIKRFATKASVTEYLRGDDHIVCVLCNKPFVNLGCHISRAHGVSSRDYKRALNIPVRAALEARGLNEAKKLLFSSRKDLVENGTICGMVYGGKVSASMHTNAPVYEDGHRRKKEAILPAILPSQPSAPAIEEFKLLPNGRFAVPPEPRVHAYRVASSTPSGYDKKSLVARVERLERALTILLNANALSLSLFEDT